MTTDPRSTTSERRFVAAVARLPVIGLNELARVAQLDDRTDRKYVVEASLATEFVETFDDRFRALEIRTERSFAYRTEYLDSGDLRFFHDTAHRRRRRHKVRIRTYGSTGESFCEVKSTAGRGRTEKRRIPWIPREVVALDDGPFDGASIDFVTDIVGSRPLVTGLRGVLTTTYRRTTLVDSGAPLRVTVDRDMTSADSLGRGVTLGEHVIIETKSVLPRTSVDRWLWQRGVRPVRFSKYATSLAALRPELPRNRWNRSMRFLDHVDRPV